MFSHLPHHLGTELELLQRHIDDNDEIAVLGCMGFLPACMHKLDAEQVRCRECTTSRSNGLRLLDRTPQMFALDEYYTEADRQAEANIQTTFNSIEEIQDYQFDGFDLGYAALSSTVFSCRDAYLESQKDRDLLGRMIISAYRSFCAVREFLRQHPEFDRTYIFNGRFATCRGAFRACQQAGMHVFLHERGSDNSKYMLYENSLPHDLQRMEDRIRQRWSEATAEDRKWADKFFADRRERVEAFWHSHTKAQQSGRMPASWDDNRRNVAIYTSSDDEYVAIGKEWVSPGFDSQSQAIANLYHNLQAENSDIHLYVRMHPHLKGVDNKDTRLVRSLQGPGIEVILPESDVCSYTLMDHSEKILTFGSTIGIEATYWGKPSILAGMNFYRSLDGAWIASGDDELLELIKAQLEPKSKEAAMMYGYHMTTFGDPFKYYSSANFETGTFRGTYLRNASGYSPFGWLLPSITRTFGRTPRLRSSIEQAAWATCHLPFAAIYNLTLPFRKLMRSPK